MGGNRGRRSLQPVSDEAINRKVNLKLDRQRKKIESQVRCVQEVLTSDAHPVVRNAVENKISALLGSPAICQNSPLLSSEYAEESVRTPPGMQRRMDMFKERIELHNNPSFQDISPTLIPTQNFLIKTGRKPPAPCLPPNRSPVDPLLSSLVESDVSSDDASTCKSKRSIGENSSEEPPAKRQRSSCDDMSAKDQSADVLFEEISFMSSLCDDSNRSLPGEASRKMNEKRLFGGSRTADEIEYCNIDKENKPPVGKKCESKNREMTFVSETNEFSFLNFNNFESDSGETENVSTEVVPDSLKVVHDMVSQSSDSNVVLGDNAAQNSSNTSQRSSMEFSSQVSPIKLLTDIQKGVTQKSGKRKVTRLNVACSQPFFSHAVEGFDVFESSRLSLPRRNKVLLKHYPQVVRLPDTNASKSEREGMGCWQCHVRRDKENRHNDANSWEKETINGANESSEAATKNDQFNEFAYKNEKEPKNKQTVESNQQSSELLAASTGSEVPTYSNTEVVKQIFSNGANDELRPDPMSVSEMNDKESHQADQVNKENDVTSEGMQSEEKIAQPADRVAETAPPRRSRRSIWKDASATVVAQSGSSNTAKRVTRSQSGANSSDRKSSPEAKRAKQDASAESNPKGPKRAAMRRRKTVVGEPLIDSAVLSTESAPSDVRKNEQTEGVEAGKLRNGKRDTSDPRILRDLSLPKKNVPKIDTKNRKKAIGKNIGQPIVVRSSIDNCNYLSNKCGKRQKNERKKITRAASASKTTVTKLKRSGSTSNPPLTEIVICATAVSDRQKFLLASALESLNNSSHLLLGSSDRNGRNLRATFKLSDKDHNWGLEGVTHVVCGKNNRRTLSVLFAIARGCWLLSFDWITDSVEAGCWKLENEYELTEFPGAKINRERLDALKVEALKKSKFKPNSNMPITIRPPRLLPISPLLYVLDNSQPKKHVLQYLISLTGGWIVENPLDAKFFIGPAESVKKLKVKVHQRANLMKIPVLKETWVLG